MDSAKSKVLRMPYSLFVVTLLLYWGVATSHGTTTSMDEEATLKCDACKIIANSFANSFKATEAEVGGRRLKEVEYVEAAEGTCDEDWTGYGIRVIDGVQRLAGENSDVTASKDTIQDPIWDRRLQDMCDELLAESPDEKTLYNLWQSGQASALHKYICLGEGLFKACVPGQDFGPWPGDDYDDYDDDVDFAHDEF